MRSVEQPLEQTPTLLVWDFNGTMLDDLAVAHASVEFIFRLYDVPPPSMMKFRDRDDRHFMEFYRRHGIPPWATAKHLSVIRQDYYLARLGRIQFRPSLRNILAQCREKGIRLAICSGEIEAILAALVDRDCLRSFFEPSSIRAQAWGGKEHELKRLCDRLQVPCAQAAYLDDTTDGVRVARAAGLQSIGFAHGTSWNTAARIEAAKPDRIAHDLKDLQVLLDL